MLFRLFASAENARVPGRAAVQKTLIGSGPRDDAVARNYRPVVVLRHQPPSSFSIIAIDAPENIVVQLSACSYLRPLPRPIGFRNPRRKPLWSM